MRAIPTLCALSSIPVGEDRSHARSGAAENWPQLLTHSLDVGRISLSINKCEQRFALKTQVRMPTCRSRHCLVLATGVPTSVRHACRTLGGANVSLWRRSKRPRADTWSTTRDRVRLQSASWRAFGLATRRALATLSYLQPTSKLTLVATTPEDFRSIAQAAVGR
jgi:hypothetical protein